MAAVAADPFIGQPSGHGILCPPGGDQQPRHPRRAQNFCQHDRESVRLREPAGACHPALHEVGELDSPIR